jgi:propanol-preferring alcohol dehydrogenase
MVAAPLSSFKFEPCRRDLPCSGIPLHPSLLKLLALQFKRNSTITNMMKAFKLVAWGQAGQYVNVAIPEAGPGDVLVRMKAAGLCRSDLDMLDHPPDTEPYSTVLEAGYTLGHENAGVVEKLGFGVNDLEIGESVVIHHLKHCGLCQFCQNGSEQHCDAFKRGHIGMTRGCGLDGGLAEFLVVPRRELVSIGDRDPVTYAPLTDAGVTAYHAIRSFAHRVRPNSTAAIIGIGGLGAYGVQFIKLLSQAKIFALDTSDQCLELGKELGADHVVRSDGDAASTILELTHGKGIDFIVDFVGSDQTLGLCAAISRPQGRITVVGMQGGSLRVGWTHMATACEFTTSLGSTMRDLAEVCQLASDGKLRIELQRFNFDQVQEAYNLLRAGKLKGRAVITF